ncbi:zinc finger CCHC domain-containing protein 3-like [Hyperolius riggenbachi]|uniref:zinc finger CCHC domain-containing protein 3-like n=1 Tax=Hyperolius riggenbachi TaxID=752182 RepID=UPI0035A26661
MVGGDQGSRSDGRVAISRPEGLGTHGEVPKASEGLVEKSKEGGGSGGAGSGMITAFEAAAKVFSKKNVQIEGMEVSEAGGGEQGKGGTRSLVQAGKRRGDEGDQVGEGKKRLVGTVRKEGVENKESGGEGNNMSAESKQQVAQNMQKVMLKQKSDVGVSYAQMLEKRVDIGEMATKNDEYGMSARNRRKLVRVCFKSSDEITYTRKTFIQLLMKMGFKAVDFYAILAPENPPSFFDVSFLSPTGLDTFWEKYESTWKMSEEWKELFPQTVSRQSLDKKITIVVPNESIPVHDLLVWLKNYGVPLSAPKKVMDEFGIWGVVGS